jgi:hypothetical protein
MRRHLGSFLPALLLVAVPTATLAACDDDSGPVARDPEPTAAAAYRLVDTITVTGAGGTVSAAAVPLGDHQAVEGFLEQFHSDDLAEQVQAAVARTDVPGGQQLYGAVIAIGCDEPDRVEVDVSGESVAITAVPVPSPMPECFAAMTTVALVLVDR